MSEQFEPFVHALKSPQALLDMRMLLLNKLDKGSTREELVELLERLRLQLQAADRDADEDIVLEALDLLTGWCSEHMGM